MTIKFVVEFEFPLLEERYIAPVVAFAGTVAVMTESEITVNDAMLPLNDTFVTAEKCIPLIVTIVPALPYVGVKL